MAINRLRVELGRPGYGRVELTIDTGQFVLKKRTSSSAGDSIGDLAGALVTILKGGSDAVVTWTEQPAEFVFRFRGDEDHVLLNVIRWPDNRRVSGTGQELLAIRGARLDICLPFWRALQRLQTYMPSSEYKSAWGHAFPDQQLAELTALTQHHKQQVRYRPE